MKCDFLSLSTSIPEDASKMRDLRPADVARNYIDTLYSIDKAPSFLSFPPSNDPIALWEDKAKKAGRCSSRISISTNTLQGADGLERAIRRSMLISDTKFVIGENAGEVSLLHHIEDVDVDLVEKSLYSAEDLNHLGERLLTLRPLIASGELVYLPVLHYKHEVGPPDGSYLYREPYHQVHLKEQIDLLLKTMCLGKPSNTPLAMALELPVIDGTNLKDLVQIRQDLANSFDRFRDFMERTFEELDDSSTEKNLRHVERRVREQVREVEDEWRIHSRKAAFNAAGVILGSCSAILYYLTSEAHIVNMITSLLAGSGAAAVGAKVLRDIAIERARLKTKDGWFIWLMSDKRLR